MFRIILGFLFFSHGAQKLFGWFGGTAISSVNLFWFAGLIEFLVGLGVFFGLFTRLAALGGAIQMVVAFIKVHLPSHIHPLMNGGEAAVLFFAAFLVLLAFGPGTCSLGALIFKKEVL